MFYVNRSSYLDAASGKGRKGMPSAGSETPAYEAEPWQRLEKTIRLMPACNHFVIPGSERASLDEFLEPLLLNKPEESSRGLLEGVRRLLGVSEERITPGQAEDVRRRYAAFCGTHTSEEYYHHVGGIAGVHTLGLLGNAEEGKEPGAEPGRLRYVASLDSIVRMPRENEVPAEQSMPRRFSDLVERVTRRVHACQASPGIMGIHLNLGAWRSLEVREVDEAAAYRAYETARPSESDRAIVEDFLVVHVLRVCGGIGLPVQIRSGTTDDAGGNLLGGNPALLRAALAAAAAAKTRIILTGGGYPYTREAGLIARREGCWIDLSFQSLQFTPRVLAMQLREWLELAGPGKILFGTGRGGLGVIAGMWCVRRALALTLGDMMSEGLCSEHDALETARDVLEGNAARVYGLTAPA